MIIKPNKKEVVVSVTLELNLNEVSCLRVALNDYMRLMREHGNLKGGNSWAWVEEFHQRLGIS